MAVSLAKHVPTYADAPESLSKLASARRRDGMEVAFDVDRGDLVEVMRSLRDEHDYQQLMEIAGVDYPDRPERFEIVYCLLSLTRNHRIRVHVRAGETTPVPSLTGLWPVAGWLEREVFDMYGVAFSGNSDLRRILTDYGFEGFPQRKDFPLTGHVELRYSEAEKRVVYQPVDLPQDFRTFDFLMPWEGPDYRLLGDEKAAIDEPAPPPTPKTTETPAQTGAGKPADKAAKREARKPNAAKAEHQADKGESNIAEPKPKGRGRRRPTGAA